MQLFVYGTLKRGFHNHYVLGDAKFIGDYITKPVYTMLDIRGAFPALRLGGTTAIIGEVYDINDLELVDQLEGYPTLYDRSEIATDYGNAWVYHFDFNNPLAIGSTKIEDGNWK